ncbi:hypothetical protein P4C99_09735 [Pontiellaceae bacterium B1224]|nr:hypothetical protein [Pontiellaceae bacterium B1224]
MFLEVFAVRRKDYTEATGISLTCENRRLIEMTGARIRSSALFPDRAEIILPSKATLLCAGSYEELVTRMEKAENGFARAKCR